jgi:hypothetical protein
MEKDLIKFYESIKYINKDLAKYEDEKGNIQFIPIPQLICNVSYEELSKEQLKTARFQQLVGKDQKFEIINTTKAVSKETITKKPEDKFTLVDTTVAVSQVWFVTNGLKIVKAFDNKEEAVKAANDINEKVLANLLD